MKNFPIKLFWLFCVVFSSNCLADARKSKFRDNPTSSSYISLGAFYNSDQNSKEYKIAGTYQYSGARFINDLDLLFNSRYTDTTKNSLVQNKQLYDGELSSKMLIGNSSNYFNYYNRSKYDKFSDYYRDITNSVGWGRLFFGGILEADINIGYNEIKNFDSQIVLNPNLKASFWLTNNIKFTTKVYLFKVQDSYYEELKSKITYKLNDNVSLELSHNYDKKSYFYKTLTIAKTKNEVSRDIVARIRYDF